MSQVNLKRVDQLLERYSRAFGVSGAENLQASELLIEDMRGLVDEIERDGLGGVIGLLRGNGDLKVMLAAHVDQIGFMVSHVDDKGFIRFIPIGGWDERTLANRVVRFVLRGEEGYKEVLGVIGAKPPHLLEPKDREKPHKLKELHVDIGATSREEVERLGIRKGTTFTLKGEYYHLYGDRVVGQAFDDRVGVVVMLRALELLKERREELKVNVYAVGTVQEEVGLRGAKVAAYKVNPDYGVALDVTIAGDVPGTSEHEHISKLGEGPVITLVDRSFIANSDLVSLLESAAKEEGIPYQIGVMSVGGTDSGAITLTREGVPSVTLSIPTRYIHSTVELLDLRDVENAAKLLASFLLRAHELRR